MVKQSKTIPTHKGFIPLIAIIGIAILIATSTAGYNYIKKQSLQQNQGKTTDLLHKTIPPPLRPDSLPTTSAFPIPSPTSPASTSHANKPHPSTSLRSTPKTLPTPSTKSNTQQVPAITYSPFFTDGSTDTSFDINVLVIKYFPLTPDGQNIDISATGDVGETYQTIRQRTIDVTNNLKSSLEKATTYLGYKDLSAQPALRYHVIDTKEYTQAVPIKPRPGKPTYPDYFGIMQSNNICDYVNSGNNVSEVWLWAYQGPNKSDGAPYLGIYESKMSGPDDISNSGRENDMPKCNKSYRVYKFNYDRGTSEALESWGHQMEAELNMAGSYLFRTVFQGNPYPLKNGVTGRCGSVHNPPNSTGEYDRGNSTPNKSDCLDWNPDGMGTLSDISCENWGCNGDPSLYYQIWNWQNLPGRNNNKYYQGKKLSNWWETHANFDDMMQRRR